jgi:hypothetical protein
VKYLKERGKTIDVTAMLKTAASLSFPSRLLEQLKSESVAYAAAASGASPAE